ncbi:MAG: glycosyltransferase family 87 protein [Tepidisphaeraceae bacterium]
MSDLISTSPVGPIVRRTTRRGGFELLFLLCLAGAARLAWLAILPAGAISLDLNTWIWVANDLLNNINPYSAPPWIYHPPFWTEVLFGLANLSRRTGIDFILSVKLVLIAGDLSLLAATFLLLRTLRPGSSCTRLLAIGYCLNPLLILLTAQHGNFDALLMVWVVLFHYFLLRFRKSSDAVDWLLSAGCLGIAVYVKQFPLVLWPLLVPGARQLDWRSRLAGPLLVIAPALLSLAPLFVLAPDPIMRNVVEYRGLGNTFGVVGLMSLAGLDNFVPVYSQFFTIAVLTTTVAVSIALWRRNWRYEGDPVLFSAMLFLGLFTLGAGYGSQYWFWVVPLILVCYANSGRGFRRMILLSMIVVTATNVFEYAVEPNLGRFFVELFPSAAGQSLGDYFHYPSRHLIWLRLPMTIASFGLLSSGIKALFYR